ncbi:hypothetical protein GHT06_008812 [Daphnia sinensis]|uniref:Endonuclease/exonuclease/phosphatase domain-containing protein n=1 Tax=Daphnia sinensis TaxID=1820382 RepID=A0AAD5Q2L9_9CRUS|nr:hypothetical protein GHT06_008812 [Daphnia sinensis]
MTRIPVQQFPKCEIVGFTITFSIKTKIDVYSIYCPDGNESILNLLHYLSKRRNHCIIGGDFNGHSPRWSNSHLSNKIGREISSFLTNSDNLTLLTPKNFPTRIDPVTRKKSTLDLTIMSSQLAHSTSIKLGPHLGSDHLPIIFKLQTKEKIIKQKIQPKWKYKEKEWPKWNESITRKLSEKKFIESENPQEAFNIFHESVLESSKETFILNTEVRCSKNINKPWWNEECSKKIAEYRRAWKKYTKWPTPENRTEYNRAMALKKKTIREAEKKRLG